MGFPDSSAGKESTFNVGDPGSIPGSGRPPGERVVYPLQYSWASVIAQLVKESICNAMQQTWVWSLGWEHPLEEGMAPTPVFLPGESPWTEEPGRLQLMESQRIIHNWATSLSFSTSWFSAFQNNFLKLKRWYSYLSVTYLTHKAFWFLHLKSFTEGRNTCYYKSENLLNCSSLFIFSII